MDEASDKPVVRFGRFEADLRCGELRQRGAKVKQGFGSPKQQ